MIVCKENGEVGYATWHVAKFMEIGKIMPVYLHGACRYYANVTLVKVGPQISSIKNKVHIFGFSLKYVRNSYILVT